MQSFFFFKKNDRKDGFSPLKTKLELWFTGPAMPICPPRHPAAGPKWEGVQRGGAPEWKKRRLVTPTCTERHTILNFLFHLKEQGKQIHRNLSSTPLICQKHNQVLYLWQPHTKTFHPLKLGLCQDWIRRLKLVYISRWLFFWKACNLNFICLKSGLNL